MKRIAIFGATGYTGFELIRMLLSHPGARIEVLTSEQYSAQPLEQAFPPFKGKLQGVSFGKMERLLSAGALDVMFIPVQMKKSRPATLVEVVCQPELRDRLIRLVLSETTTIGVRWREEARTKLARRPVTVSTRFGEIDAKEVVTPDGSIRVTPEYESCRKAALASGAPIQEIYRAVAASVKE